MNKKRIQIGLIIITILLVAFFWGNNKTVNPLTSEQMDKDEVILDENIENEDDIAKDLENKDEDLNKENKEENIDIEEQEKEVDSKEEESKKQESTDPKQVKKQAIEDDNKSKDKKDKYLTDPTPEGKPKPVEWQDTSVEKDKKLTATLSVTCKTILNNMDLFNMDKINVLPDDGIIYATKKVEFYEGESVFDVLHREMKNNKIHMEFSMTPIYNSNYIEGINNLYEFDCGELSGWMYQVNGWFPNYGASRYKLEDGDKIEWIYTCDLGRDINRGSAVTQTEVDD